MKTANINMIFLLFSYPSDNPVVFSPHKKGQSSDLKSLLLQPEKRITGM